MTGNRKIFGAMGIGLLLLVGMVLFGFPLYWMIRGAVISQALWLKEPIVWIPAWADVHLTEFANAFLHPEYRLGRGILNSAIIALATMFFNVLFSSMAGFALAKMRVPGRRFWIMVLLITIMIPFESMMVSLYLIVARMGMADTLAGILLPMSASAFGVIIMWRFFQGVPDDLIEAALIDGADWGTILFKIAMPLATPAIATVAVFNFLAGWESFVWPMLITDPHSRFDVLQKIIAGATFESTAGTSGNTQWPFLMAMALIAVMPVLVMFIFGHKYFVKGLTSGAIKG